MIDLFSKNDLNPVIRNLNDKIIGLSIIDDLITDKEHDQLMVSIDKNKWSNELQRRVQHYGYKYDYRSKSINNSMVADSIPEWAIKIGKRLVGLKIFRVEPDQIIVNEYLPGQGISSHIDCEPCFGDTIVSLSLNSSAVMQFSRSNSDKRVEEFLFAKSAIVLKSDARYKWSHCIPSRKSDYNGKLKISRKRRISLTFRNIILE